MSLFHQHDVADESKDQNESKPKIEVNVTVNGKSYVSGMGSQPKNDIFEECIKSHTERLLAFYREQSAIYRYGQDATSDLIKQVNPHTNNNTCPYCGVVHPFTAARARKCPACGEKMVVRNGLFLKEADAERLQVLSNDFYSKAQSVERLKNTIQSIQDEKQRKNYGRSFLEVAEAYDLCAVIHNQSYEGGFTNWDYAWRVLNGDALESVSVVSTSQVQLLSKGYADIVYARGMHLLREMKYAREGKSQSKYAQIAIAMFFEFLIELQMYNLSHWQQDSAVKNIHIAINYAHVTDDQVDEVISRLRSRPNMAYPDVAVEQVVKEVKDYVLVETEPERLEWMIY